MKKLNKTAIHLISKMAYANAKKEADSACIFIGYQPRMPEKVKDLKRKKG